MAPNRIYDDPRITDPTTLAVYGALARLGNVRTGNVQATYETIGKRARCSARNANRHVKLLVALGYVLAVPTRGRVANRYHLVDQKGLQDEPDEALPSDSGWIVVPKIPRKRPSTMTPVTRLNAVNHDTGVRHSRVLPEPGAGLRSLRSAMASPAVGSKCDSGGASRPAHAFPDSRDMGASATTAMAGEGRRCRQELLSSPAGGRATGAEDWRRSEPVTDGGAGYPARAEVPGEHSP